MYKYTSNKHKKINLSFTLNLNSIQKRLKLNVIFLGGRGRLNVNLEVQKELGESNNSI